jgi:hypothetical protein
MRAWKRKMSRSCASRRTPSTTARRATRQVSEMSIFGLVRPGEVGGTGVRREGRGGVGGDCVDRFEHFVHVLTLFKLKTC